MEDRIVCLAGWIISVSRLVGLCLFSSLPHTVSLFPIQHTNIPKPRNFPLLSLLSLPLFSLNLENLFPNLKAFSWFNYNFSRKTNEKRMRWWIKYWMSLKSVRRREKRRRCLSYVIHSRPKEWSQWSLFVIFWILLKRSPDWMVTWNTTDSHITHTLYYTALDSSHTTQKQTFSSLVTNDTDRHYTYSTLWISSSSQHVSVLM